MYEVGIFARRKLVRERICLPGISHSHWSSAHDLAVDEWWSSPFIDQINFYADKVGETRVLSVCVGSQPNVPAREIFYFFKVPKELGSKDIPEINEKTFHEDVHYGLVRTDLPSTIKLLREIYSPMIFAMPAGRIDKKCWQASIKEDFLAELNKFLLSMTQTQSKLDGKTVLFVPQDALLMSPEEALANKSMIMRLETSVLRWTGQIKEVLSSSKSFEASDQEGPLEELDFWRKRVEDLKGINEQLGAETNVAKAIRLLQMAKSSYLGPFLSLAQQIKEVYAEADSNFKFLTTLAEQCAQLQETHPKDLPPLYLKIINTIRFIWIHSPYLSTPEFISALFRKVGNGIINACISAIDLERVFKGFYHSSKLLLTQCVVACREWRNAYNYVRKLHLDCVAETLRPKEEKEDILDELMQPDELPPQIRDVGWDAEESTIFGLIEAFEQRCVDLLEINKTLHEFARFEEGVKMERPIFQGQYGKEIERYLFDIEANFEGHLASLSENKEEILDVKATSWHHNFDVFRTAVKEMEIMLQNTIDSAMDWTMTTEQGVEYLENFNYLSAREVIKRTLDRRTDAIWARYTGKVAVVKREFLERNIDLFQEDPPYAGRAMWANELTRRIDTPMRTLKRAPFLNKCARAIEGHRQYETLRQVIEEYVRTTHLEWCFSFREEQPPTKLMENCLLKSSDIEGYIDINVEKLLLKALVEMRLWTLLKFDNPHYIADLILKKDDLRIAKDLVLSLVRDYNRMISSIPSSKTGEGDLFKEKVRIAERKLKPGFTKKLTWMTPKIDIDYFVQECKVTVQRAQGQIDTFRVANIRVTKACRLLAHNSLAFLVPDRVYDIEEIQAEQEKAREEGAQRLRNSFDAIAVIMKENWGSFRDDPRDVQEAWKLYTQKVDTMITNSLRACIKLSLQIFDHAVNGDGKNNFSPCLKVEVLLEKGQIAFSPTAWRISALFENLIGMIIAEFALIPRLPDILTYRPGPRGGETHYQLIEKDPEKIRLMSQIDKGVCELAICLESYQQSTWVKYREVWELDKDEFINEYMETSPNNSDFETDISKYDDIANQCETEETIRMERFALIDCSPIKSSIMSHCLEWHNRIGFLLLGNTVQELQRVHDLIHENSAVTVVPPATLEELGVKILAYEAIIEDLETTELRFPIISEALAILHMFEIPVDEEMATLWADFSNEWLSYQTILHGAGQMLEKVKEKFRADLLRQAEEWRQKCLALYEHFMATGPFYSNFTSEQACEIMGETHRDIDRLRVVEAEIRRGLLIFRMDLPPSHDLLMLERHLGEIEGIWEIAMQWDRLWDEWRLGAFATLRTEVMEDTSNELFKKLTLIDKSLKKSGFEWSIVASTCHRVDEFRRTMPLVTDLHNHAMRARHWEQIKAMMGKDFDETDEGFNLEKIMELEFAAFAEGIHNTSDAATKELVIEMGLIKINNIWLRTEESDGMCFDLTPYKDQGHYKLKAGDDIFTLLEENQMQVSSMKASRFCSPFRKEVDYWEKALNQITEVTEMLLKVQTQWLYLENIFQGEDIRRQLPKESDDFDRINLTWRDVTQVVAQDPNCVIACHSIGILKTLIAMSEELEVIERALEQYLETKRQIFPRFYFISNDILLEILGNSKNPPEVMKHMRAMFDNIKSLKLEPAKQDPKKFVAKGMQSSDGEYIDFLFNGPLLDGPVESWLCDIEHHMRLALRDVLCRTRMSLRKHLTKRDKWIKEWPGQPCITASSMQWTGDTERSLKRAKEKGDKKPLKLLKRKYVQVLNKFSEAIRGNLTKIARLKVVALVTIQVHERDTIDRLIKVNARDITHFEWLIQLRFYWEKFEKDWEDCVIRQTNSYFNYGYEYLGNSGRLVITPLTDRCYVTLTTALSLFRGGSPKGPAGTGKTETTKDLGKAMGIFVIVINCSDGLDYKSMGKLFSGYSQTGFWGCFDEFNRINIEVLSVVAQQILSILTALQNKQTKFIFEGREIRLVWSCGIFITMNPGYAGRTELPDNLKAMFRPISMCVPDSTYIAEITLFGEGFSNTKVLAKKCYTLYSLATQQLSKQDHYDYGLRSLAAVLRYAGRKKRDLPNLPDDEIILLAMKDMNIPRLTANDVPLFSAVMVDLFPGINIPTVDYSKFEGAVTKSLKANNLQSIRITYIKIIQLYETMCSRHSIMLVGQTQVGKTVAWKTLQEAKKILSDGGDEKYKETRVYPINPKAITLEELYGDFDLATNEWTDGVLSSVMRFTCLDESKATGHMDKWINFDGPVDTVWIESMNSVMDDNKILTLINGERINMPENVILLFETQDLSQASPATVSRTGVVYLDYQDMGWRPYINSWLALKDNAKLKLLLEDFCERYLGPCLEYKRWHCSELIPSAELTGVKSLCSLFDSLATKENGMDPNRDPDAFANMAELWFLFSLIWSVGATLDDMSRKKFDTMLRELNGQFPSKDSIYEYYVDVQANNWYPWEEKLKSGWRFNPDLPFYKIIVPTVDTVRYEYVLVTQTLTKHPVLIVGPIGTGKTSVAASGLSKLDPWEYRVLVVNMSAQTSSKNVQDNIEGNTEKKIKGVYGPIGGKKMVCFLDDVNMPVKDAFGSQPPIELLLMWMDYAYWYNRKDQTKVHVIDTVLMAAMGPPGGGRQVISKRFQARFHMLNMIFPSEDQIRRIFGTMLNHKMLDFPDEARSKCESITDASIDLYKAVSDFFLPTPAKIHYLYNLRDISRMFQGLLLAHKDYHDSKPVLVRLWIHEAFRVFADRLINRRDIYEFEEILDKVLGRYFNEVFHNTCPDRVVPIFGDFCNKDMIYEDLANPDALRKHMYETQVNFNNTIGNVPMDLVLFRYAIEHVARVVRGIRQPKGNMLLVGIGGSGRQSLTRLASFICEYTTFQIEVAKNYRRQEFREDLKGLYKMAGIRNKQTTFLFNDTQCLEEAFLEDINNILSSGEVPNLYTKADELEDIRSALADEGKKQGIEDTVQNMFAFLLDRVKANLHIVVCMSPIGEPFRNRVRMYPALVNCNTIDWFLEWPQEALLEVAQKYLEHLDLQSAWMCRPAIAKVFAIMHGSVGKFSERLLAELNRHNYVTPTNYLELTGGYETLLYEKRKELKDAADRLRNGLWKIDDTRDKVEVMQLELKVKREKLAKQQAELEAFLRDIAAQTLEANEQTVIVEARKIRIKEEEAKCIAISEQCEADLAEAMPALERAVGALDTLDKKDIGEIRGYTTPPKPVEKVLAAVMVLMGEKEAWAEAKKVMGDIDFLNKLKKFDKESISDKVLKRIDKICNDPEFDPDYVAKFSVAAKCLCMWVRAMDEFAHIWRVVEPKQRRYDNAMRALENSQRVLREAEEKLQALQERIAMLKEQYAEQLILSERAAAEAAAMEILLDRATRLIDGLADEKVRWEATVEDLMKQDKLLIGDCLVSAAFLSYMGPFLSQYREEMLTLWLDAIDADNIPRNMHYKFADFLSRPTQVREWNIQGLPADSFSTENGVIVARCSRWPLLVDPQCQAIKWIRRMEAKNNLIACDLQTKGLQGLLHRAVEGGFPFLVQNIQEALDPSIDPILCKAYTKVGSVIYVKVGDNDVIVNPKFRMYFTTKLTNPHYPPEISARTTITNFAIKEQGLESQLLGIVVRKERVDLEEQKDQMVLSIAGGKAKLEELETTILRLLNETKGSLLDDATLVDVLADSKITSVQVGEQLVVAEETNIMIDAARELYRPCAERSTILFFVMNDLGKMDPMYQFSLDSYLDLFANSIEKSQKSPNLERRIEYINEYHTYAVYRYTCRGLFEIHKLLFSFQMCVKIMENEGKLNKEEYDFFLKGGVVLDRNDQILKPDVCAWLSATAWDNITELALLPNFKGLVDSFEQYWREWQAWYTCDNPETTKIPGGWEDQCNELQRMLIVRSLRPDRVTFCTTSFIINNLGLKFVEPPVLDLNQVLDDSTNKSPLIFVLSPGVDPTSSLMGLATQARMIDKFHAISLGQGQAVIATEMIKDGTAKGWWVFLANCHLSMSWMPQLDKIVEQMQVDEPHPEFRLWLSSSPAPNFPISILQNGIKITTEPPKGLKANLKRLYSLMSESQFSRCRKAEKFKKLLFSLCFFHSICLERKKFLQLGWNINYPFNDSDYEISENLLAIYLDEYDETPWDALKYLIAGICYGGHITDDMDRRLLMVYSNEYFNEKVLTEQMHTLSILPDYYIPYTHHHTHLSHYREYVSMLPQSDHPEAFGQHPNADIASQIKEAQLLFDVLISLKPKTSSAAEAGAKTAEEVVMELAASILEKLPTEIDYEQCHKNIVAMTEGETMAPINVVLLQEILRYNNLLNSIKSSLKNVQKAIKGLVVMSSELEQIYGSMFEAKVPLAWSKLYPTVKPLAAWTRDLVKRVEAFEKWASTMHAPVVYWMAMFAFPAGFLTAVLQTTARRTNISVDVLTWEFSIIVLDDHHLRPQVDGVYVKGFYLEGAGWEKKGQCLCEATPMQLVCPMPTMMFKPIEPKKKNPKGLYNCPMYYFPNRAGGSGRASFVLGVDLKSGAKPSEHWTKRGTALLMSLEEEEED